MTILDLVHSLRTVLRGKVERGSLSVGLLARQSSLTKSHISRFLHAKGGLSIPAMKSIMQSQHLDVEDLISLIPGAPARDERTHFIPLVANRSALLEPVIGAGSIESWLPVSAETLNELAHRRVRTRQSWWRFVAIRIDKQEAHTMGGLAAEGALIVIDRHYNSIRDHHPKPRGLYAVLDGNKLVLGYADAIGRHLVIQPRTTGMRAKVIYLDPNGDAGEYIIGRIVMITNVLR
jgi:hypothetical protein